MKCCYATACYENVDVHVCSNWRWSRRKAMNNCVCFRHVLTASCRPWLHLLRAVSSLMSKHWSLAWLTLSHSWMQPWKQGRDVMTCGVITTLNVMRSRVGLHLSRSSWRPNHRNEPAWRTRKLHLTFIRLAIQGASQKNPGHWPLCVKKVTLNAQGSVATRLRCGGIFDDDFILISR